MLRGHRPGTRIAGHRGPSRARHRGLGAGEPLTGLRAAWTRTDCKRSPPFLSSLALSRSVSERDLGLSLQQQRAAASPHPPRCARRGTAGAAVRREAAAASLALPCRALSARRPGAARCARGPWERCPEEAPPFRGGADHREKQRHRAGAGARASGARVCRRDWHIGSGAWSICPFWWHVPLDCNVCGRLCWCRTLCGCGCDG